MHILSPETDNCPSWISGRERMTVENISWSISTKECCRPRRGLNPRPPGLQSDGASNWATEAIRVCVVSVCVVSVCVCVCVVCAILYGRDVSALQTRNHEVPSANSDRDYISLDRAFHYKAFMVSILFSWYDLKAGVLTPGKCRFW